MLRSMILVFIAACDVGSVLPAEGAQPDAGGGAGGADAAVETAPLKITFTTSPSAGGVYAPAHVLAVWIQDQGGAIVKTIDRRADVRRQHLVAWSQLAGLADVDAITGATRIGHDTPLTIGWDLKDRQGAIVPDGTYTIRMEVADVNATQPGENNQGTFTFVKGTDPQVQTGLTDGGFTNVSITFTP